MIRITMLAVLLLAMVSPALALQESETLETYSYLELALPGRGAAPVFANLGADDSRGVSLAGFLGGRWSLQENALTGTTHLAWGSGTPMTGVAGADDITLEYTARALVRDLPELFGVASEQLRLESVHHAGGKSVVWFGQLHGGVPVEGARVHVLFHDSGRLMGLGSDAHPGIDIATAPALDRAAAIVLARSGLPFLRAVDELVSADLVITPLDLSSGLEYRLAWRVLIDSETPPGRWNTLLDAMNGSVISRHNEICLTNVVGTVVGDVHETGWCDGDTPGTLFPNMTVTMDGGGGDITDGVGAFEIVHGGTDPVSVTGRLAGPWLEVSIFENNFPAGSITGIFNPGMPGELNWTDASARDDELDTFVHSNRIHDFMKGMDASFTGLDYVMPCIVDRTDGYCPGNAWWDYTGINFCRADGGYSNTGTLGNVIYHEYGHGITAKVYEMAGQSQPISPLHEGNSDVAGLLMDDESIVGLGFYTGNCVSGIRNSDNDLVYPDDYNSGSGHYSGQILAGVYWDAYVHLRDIWGLEYARDAVGQAWHDGRRLGLPTNFPDQVYWTFVADDDDGNLDNGTPHYTAFCAGAEHHGFECPEVIFGVVFEHAPLGDTTDEVNPYLVETLVTSTEGLIDPSSVLLRYRVSGGLWSELPMSHDGGDAYSASIPAQSTGSEVEYYLYAEDLDGLTGTDPDEAPGVNYSFFVAWLIDPLESAVGWTVDPDGTDNAHSSGVWVHVDPVGSDAQPDDDHTSDGTHCWVTGQHVEGNPASDDDVDYGRTTLRSPVYDLTGAVSASLRYWKWFENGNGYDVFDLWLSNDGGDSWTRVENDPVSTNGWVDMVHYLGDHFATPGLLRLKFTASDFGSVSTVEAAVDDISILADFGDLTAVDEGVTVEFVTGLAQNSPNPFNPTTKISFSLAEAGPVNLTVYDARGRLIKELVKGSMSAGEQQVIWDGRDTAGGALASGIYLYRLETPDGVIAKRMTLLK